MTDKPGNGTEQDATTQDTPNGEAIPPLVINGQYIKDLSFESPNSPSILSALQNSQPDVNVNVDVKATKLESEDVENMFEVVVDIKAELKLDDKVGFIIELQYAGVFTLNVPEEHLGAVLLIECPRMLFPYARNIVSDTTRDGGFVPLFLQPLDFAAMYQANIQKQTAELDKDVAKMISENEKTVN